jgi:hypothetical protein
VVTQLNSRRRMMVISAERETMWRDPEDRFIGIRLAGFG